MKWLRRLDNNLELFLKFEVFPRWRDSLLLSKKKERFTWIELWPLNSEFLNSQSGVSLAAP